MKQRARAGVDAAAEAGERSAATGQHVGVAVAVGERGGGAGGGERVAERRGGGVLREDAPQRVLHRLQPTLGGGDVRLDGQEAAVALVLCLVGQRAQKRAASDAHGAMHSVALAKMDFQIFFQKPE